MIEGEIIPFNKPSKDLIDIAQHILIDIEYQPHDIDYALKGFFHVLLMHKAEKLKSEDELLDYIKAFSINFERKYYFAFTFNVQKFIDAGLLLPKGTKKVVEAFDRDLINMYPGFPADRDRDAKYRTQVKSAYSFSEHDWNPTDFLNPDIIKQGKEFGMGIWSRSVQTYEKYSRPEMNEVVFQNAQKLINYYDSILQQIK